MSTCSEEYGLTHNIKKTKFMVILKKNPLHLSLSIDGMKVVRVEIYTFLEAMVNYTNDYIQKFRTRR